MPAECPAQDTGSLLVNVCPFYRKDKGKMEIVQPQISLGLNPNTYFGQIISPTL